MSRKKAISSIEFELNQIENHLNSYEALINKARDGKPDLIEMTALASVLHSFYNGIENMFIAVAKNIDKYVPKSSNWHKELLKQMLVENEVRGPLISEELRNKLIEYLAFRHFYRHSYSFYLDWEELENLVLSLNDTWNKVKEEMTEFISEKNR